MAEMHAQCRLDATYDTRKILHGHYSTNDAQSTTLHVLGQPRRAAATGNFMNSQAMNTLHCLKIANENLSVTGLSLERSLLTRRIHGAVNK
jgi:hypothetical protein